MDAILITLASLTFLFVLFGFAFSRLPVRFAGESLRSDIDNLRTLLDAADESVMLLDADGTLLEINDTGMARFGLSRPEMVGENFFGFLPPRLAELRRNALQDAAAARQLLTGEEWEAGRCLAWRLHPILHGTQPVTRFWLFAKDVTGDRQLQAIEAVFHQFDQRLLRHRANMQELASQLCHELVPLFDLRAVWIARHEPHGQLHFMAGAGDQVNELADALIDVGPYHGTPSIVWQALCAAEPCIAQSDSPAWTSLPPLVRDARSGLLIALPIYVSDTVLGVLTLHGPAQSTTTLTALFDNVSTIAHHASLAFQAAYDQSRLRLYEQALASTGSAVFITDQDGMIHWVNEAFVRVTGYTRSDVFGRKPSLFSSGLHDGAYFADMWGALQAGQVWRSDITNRRRDGSLYVAHQTISPVPGEDGRTSHYISILEDITDQKLAEERLAHQATHDALTGLANRLYFEQGLPRQLALTSRNNQRCMLMFIDLDGFKPINDTHGHAIGDRVLEAIARRLELGVRQSDQVARWGGDEFVALLPGAASREVAASVARKLLDACCEPVDVDGRIIHLGASIGIAIYPDDTADPEVLVKFADDAMYRAKMGGRNTFRFHGV